MKETSLTLYHTIKLPGHGDMAISNAVGSNVFDILLCLGLPWLLQTTVVDRNDGVTVYSAGLSIFVTSI